MASNNPALSRNPAFRPGNASTESLDLEALYGAPAATSSDTGRIGYQDVVFKTTAVFAVLLAAGLVGWQLPGLAMLGAIGALALGLVNSFKRKPSAVLTLAYGAFEGLLLGGISSFFEQQFPGVVVQAVIATLSVFGVMLALFASGKVRASARMTKIFLIAMIGYGVYSLVNVGLMVFGGASGAFGLNSMTLFGIPIGFAVGILAVLMGAYSLVLDFEFIKNAVQNRAPRAVGWQAAFGLVVTLVWLYVEFLRLFSLLQGRN